MAKKPSLTEIAQRDAQERRPTSPAKRETAKRTEILAVRLTPEELQRIRAHFEEQGIPASVGVRALALRELRGR